MSDDTRYVPPPAWQWDMADRLTQDCADKATVA